MGEFVERTFPKEFLCGVIDSESDGAMKVSDEIIDTGRWSIHYEMIFFFEGKHYRTHYSVGATENQDEAPYEYDGDEIVCREVVPQTKSVIVYVDVKIKEEGGEEK